MSKSNYLYRFKQYNDNGAYLMRRGLYDNAIHCFIQALQIINEATAKKDINDSLSSSLQSLKMGHVEVSFLVNNDDGCQSETTEVATGSEDSKGLFIFRSPIMVSPAANGSTTTQCNIDLYDRLLIFALYNLALSYHLSAIQLSCRKRLQQALTYYETAFKGLLDETDLVATPAMAILNNIGQIHSILKNNVEAKNCFQHLLRAMLYVDAMGEAKKIQDWEDLLSNAVALVHAASCSAAAA